MFLQMTEGGHSVYPMDFGGTYNRKSPSRNIQWRSLTFLKKYGVIDFIEIMKGGKSTFIIDI